MTPLLTQGVADVLAGDSGWVIVLVALLGGGGLSALLTSGSGMKNNKSTRENALIDQYQERNKERDQEIVDLKESHRAEKIAIEERVQKLEDRMRIVIQYNFKLISHIAEGKPPPPPEPPAEMYL